MPTTNRVRLRSGTAFIRAVARRLLLRGAIGMAMKSP